jgi:hypothetical protein
MSAFSADWLALREPADIAARSLAIVRLAADSLPPGVVHALDLATGTGSNMRYLAPRLAADQDWLLVDADERLLTEVPERMREAGLPQRVRLQTRPVDLSGPHLSDIVDGRSLVTASALLDLASEEWVARLSGLCRRAGAVVLFALTYNGRLDFSPAEPEDARVRMLVNRHQRTDKGFGPALGPDAPARTEDHLAGLGYHVTRAPSDWVLTPDQRDLQRQLIEGWAEAATAIEPGEARAFREWQARRDAHVAAGRSRLVVGHDDLAATRQK